MIHKQMGDGKMVKVQCIKCNREGSLTKKQTRSKGITYEYWYIEHHIGDKIKWCYLGKYEKLPEEYKRLIYKDTQTDTQINPTIIQSTKKPILGFISQKNLSDVPLTTTDTFQNHALSEPNRLFQTT